MSWWSTVSHAWPILDTVCMPQSLIWGDTYLALSQDALEALLQGQIYIAHDLYGHFRIWA